MPHHKAWRNRSSSKWKLNPLHKVETDSPNSSSTTMAPVHKAHMAHKMEGGTAHRALMALMAQDKKVVAGQLRFILARGIGQAFVTADVPPDAVRALLVDALAGA